MHAHLACTRPVTAKTSQLAPRDECGDQRTASPCASTSRSDPRGAAPSSGGRSGPPGSPGLRLRRHPHRVRAQKSGHSDGSQLRLRNPGYPQGAIAPVSDPRQTLPQFLFLPVSLKCHPEHTTPTPATPQRCHLCTNNPQPLQRALRTSPQRVLPSLQPAAHSRSLPAPRLPRKESV